MPPQAEIPPADTYRIAVDEYRFQAQFNWARTQYLLAFNAAILAAAAGLSASAKTLASLVFGLGAFAAVLSIAVIWTQHGYYRQARDHLRRVEAALGVLGDLRIDTTPQLGQRSRLVSVTQVIYLLLAAIAAANIVGLVLLHR